MRAPPLRAAIRDKKFAPAYHFRGEDEYLKEEAVRHLVDAAVDAATRDFNLDQRRGAELDGETLASLLAMPPMMAERRVVVIRDAMELRKDARAALDAYLRAPAPDLLLILTSPADAKSDKGLSELAEEVEFTGLTGAQLPKWIVARADKNHSASITPAAVELLQDAVGPDLGQLAIEIEKLVAYTNGREIDEAAVGAVVGVRRDETPARLLDAIAMRDGVQALSLLPGVLQQPKMNGVLLVMSLTTQTLALAMAKSRNVPPARLANEFYTILRSGGSNYTGRSWGEAVSAWTRAYAKWNADDLDHALHVLFQTDLALKESRVSSPEQVLAAAILAMCVGVSQREAA